MAQTIALQRGTTSVSADNTSSVTLFTQSGGTATRVIINSLVMTFSPTPNSSTTQSVGFYVTSSGGKTSVIGLIKASANNIAMQFTPAGSPNNQFLAIPLSAGNPYSAMAHITSNSTSGTGGGGASTININNTQNSTGLPQNMVSPNFYIGPSDIVLLKANVLYSSGKGTSPCTMSISYSFTTITES